MHARMVGRVLALMLLAPSPALAQGPEQLVQLEPSKGEWQLEYSGAYGGEDEHEVEALFGVTDRLAFGGEAEFEGGVIESAGFAAVYRFAKPGEHGLGLGAALSLSVDRSGHLAAAETRVIAEGRGSRWWLQGDLILRHRREDGMGGTGGAYALSLQHALAEDLWFGIEASGQAVRLGGAEALAPRGHHHAGPSLTIERELGERELEVGVAWMQRIRGEGNGSGPRLFVQLTL